MGELAAAQEVPHKRVDFFFWGGGRRSLSSRVLIQSKGRFREEPPTAQQVLNSLALADMKKRNAAKLEQQRIEELKAEVSSRFFFFFFF